MLVEKSSKSATWARPQSRGCIISELMWVLLLRLGLDSNGVGVPNEDPFPGLDLVVYMSNLRWLVVHTL